MPVPAHRRDTVKKEKVLTYLKLHLEAHGRAPTIRQVAEALDTSPSNVHRYLKQLEQDGAITVRRTETGRARVAGIRIVPPPDPTEDARGQSLRRQ